MNTREQKILQIFLSKRKQNIQNIATMLSCSYKSVQNSLASINEELESIVLIERNNDQMELSIINQEKLNIVLKEQMLNDENQNYVNSIIMDLMTNEYCKLSDFTDKYFLSSSKIASLLKEVKFLVSQYHLEVRSRQKYGLYIFGKEKDIRRIMKNILIGKYGAYKLDQKMYNNISIELKRVLGEYNYKTTDDGFTRILLYCYASKLRKSISEFDFQENLQEYYMNFDEYQISKKIIEKIHLYKSVQEICYLTVILCGSKKYHLNEVYTQEVNVMTQFGKFIKEFIHNASLRYGLELRDDEELTRNLTNHLYALVKRIQNDLQSEFIAIENIKEQYPLAYEISVDLSLELYKQLDLLINEVETLYFAIYFQLSLEKVKDKTIKKKILIICSTGGGLAQLLSLEIKKKYGPYIDEIHTSDRYNLSNTDFNKYDVVLATDPIEYSKAILVPFNLNNDCYLLDEAIKSTKKTLHLYDALKKDLFISNIQVNDKDEIIEILAKLVNKKVNLPDNYVQMVVERETLMTTEVGGLVAMPHSIKTDIKDLFVAIAVLSKPITWKEKKVQVVMLLNAGHGTNLQTFYEEFASFVSNKEKIARLINKPNYEYLVEILKDR